jgi:hypothetical protein
MEPTIYKPSIYNGDGVYNNGAGGGGNVTGGLLYKGFFTSEALAYEINPNDDYMFNDTFKFRSTNTRDRSVLTVENFNYNREDDVEISIDFSGGFTRNRNEMLGNMTSNWWQGLSAFISYDSNGQFIEIIQGVNNQSDWNAERKRIYFNFLADTEYRLKFRHIKNTDKVELWINNSFVGEQIANDPSLIFYGNTVKYGIGGIYTNYYSLLYQNDNKSYIKSTSYIKVNGVFLPRP